MYNHKLRGRPDDPKNRAIAAAEKSLAMTVQVNSLRPKGPQLQPPDVEIARSRQHYNEYRKSYALKHGNLLLREPTSKPPVVKEVDNTEMYKLDKLHTKHPPQPPVHTESIKTIYAKATRSDSSDDVSALMLLQKLKEMEGLEKNASKHSRELQVSQASQNAATQSALEQAEKEVMVAQSQLRAIQQLLKVDKTTSRSHMELGVIDEEEEMHPRTRKKKAITQVKDKIQDGKQKKMVITLNTLNKRIQQMHDKYFDEPRYKYLTLKDVKRRVKLEKNIQVLFKNEGFDPDKEISEIMLKEQYQLLQQKPQKVQISDTIEEIPPPKPVKIVRKSASIPVQRHLFTTDISSDNYLQNKAVHHSYDTRNKRSTEDSMSGIKSIGLSESIDTDSRNTEYQFESAQVDVIMSPKTSKSMAPDSDSTLHSIQDSILRSEYLMKEFDLTPGDLSAGLSNFESSQAMPRRRSNVPKRSYPSSIQEFFSATNGSEQHSGGMQKAFMEDAIRTQLKNSLYDIF